MDTRIVTLESEILRLQTELDQLKANVPAAQIQSYRFRDEQGIVELSELFGDRTDLLVVHNMGSDCAYCTAYADGFNGILTHLLDRAAFVVASPDPPNVQREFAQSRGWKFRIVSTRGTTFSKDMGFENEPGEYWPGASGFRLVREGVVRRVGFTSFEPGDKFSPVWPLFTLLDSSGRAEWEPKISSARCAAHHCSTSALTQ